VAKSLRDITCTATTGKGDRKTYCRKIAANENDSRLTKLPKLSERCCE
jgi:hypothetical protein